MLLLLLLICISSQFFETNLTKFAVIWVKKRQKACFISPGSSKLIVTKENEKRKRKSEEKQRRRRKKKTMVSLLVFIIATLKIHLAIALSKIWLDTYVLGYLSMKWNRAISFHCQGIHSSSSLLLLLLTYCKFSFNISGAEYIYFFQYFITCYLLLWFLTVFEPSAGFLFRNFCLFVFIRFLIFSQLDPADNSTWYWRVILDKYSIIIIIIIIITIIIIIATENKKGGYMLLLNIYFSLSGFQSCLRSYLHPPLSEYLFSMRRRVTKT